MVGFDFATILLSGVKSAVFVVILTAKFNCFKQSRVKSGFLHSISQKVENECKNNEIFREQIECLFLFFAN